MTIYIRSCVVLKVQKRHVEVVHGEDREDREDLEVGEGILREVHEEDRDVLVVVLQDGQEGEDHDARRGGHEVDHDAPVVVALQDDQEDQEEEEDHDARRGDHGVDRDALVVEGLHDDRVGHDALQEVREEAHDVLEVHVANLLEVAVNGHDLFLVHHDAYLFLVHHGALWVDDVASHLV